MELTAKEHASTGIRYLLKECGTGDPAAPTILFLHGAGSREDENVGEGIDKLRKNPFFASPFLDRFRIFAPQCDANRVWFDYAERMLSFVRMIAEDPATDPTRLYLVGASMGGYGTWDLAMRAPSYFAAILPLCGGGMSWYTRNLRDVPVWAFHGALDTTVFPEESRRLVEGVNARGGNARLTVFPDLGHPCWHRVYESPEPFEWLLAHRKVDGKSVTDDGFTDPIAFG